MTAYRGSWEITWGKKGCTVASHIYIINHIHPDEVIFLTLGLTQGKNICLSEAFLWARASAAAQMGPSQKQAALNLASTQKREQGQADIEK